MANLLSFLDFLNKIVESKVFEEKQDISVFFFSFYHPFLFFFVILTIKPKKMQDETQTQKQFHDKNDVDVETMKDILTIPNSIEEPSGLWEGFSFEQVYENFSNACKNAETAFNRLYTRAEKENKKELADDDLKLFKYYVLEGYKKAKSLFFDIIHGVENLFYEIKIHPDNPHDQYYLAILLILRSARMREKRADNFKKWFISFKKENGNKSFSDINGDSLNRVLESIHNCFLDFFLLYPIPIMGIDDSEDMIIPNFFFKEKGNNKHEVGFYKSYKDWKK